MGAYLSQPNTEKHSEDGEGPGNLRYGVSEMQGWRMHMEVCKQSPSYEEYHAAVVMRRAAGLLCVPVSTDIAAMPFTFNIHLLEPTIRHATICKRSAFMPMVLPLSAM